MAFHVSNEELVKKEVETEMAKIMIKDQEDLETWLLWSGGSWWHHEDIEYTGKTLVQQELKLPVKNLTCELLFEHVRKALGLSYEEKIRITYERRLQLAGFGPERHLVPIDIINDQGFKYFMEVVDTLPKPITLYHCTLNGPKNLVRSQDEKEADVGVSQLLINRMSTVHHSWMGEESHITLPNDKVGVLFGNCGETIKKVLTVSGARIQLFPKCFEFKGMTLRVFGDKAQIEMAEELIKEVINQELEVKELVSWVFWSGGEWDKTEYKGESLVKHVLSLPSNLTWSMLETHVTKELGLDQGLKLSYNLLSTEFDEVGPAILTDQYDFLYYVLAIAENLVPEPKTLYIVKADDKLLRDMLIDWQDEEISN